MLMQEGKLMIGGCCAQPCNNASKPKKDLKIARTPPALATSRGPRERPGQGWKEGDHKVL